MLHQDYQVLGSQVHQKAEDIAAPILAAQQRKEAAKETKRKMYVATGPARQSKRAGAERTRAKLQQQAQCSAESSDNEQSTSFASQESQSADDSASKPTVSKQSRKRSAQEANFDPAGQIDQSPVRSHSSPAISRMSALRQTDKDRSCVQMWQARHRLTLMQRIQTGQMTRTSCQVLYRWQPL